MIETSPPTRLIARRTQLLALGVLAATAAAAGGCAKGTYLEIDFKGVGLPAVRQINLTLTDNSNMKYSAGVLPDGVDAASTDTVKFPVSVAFQLDDLPGGTPLAIKADAISPANAPVAHAQTNTTVMHAKTWKTTLDFAAGVVVSLLVPAGDAELPAGGGGSADGGAGGSPAGEASGSAIIDDESGRQGEDRPTVELHLTR